MKYIKNIFQNKKGVTLLEGLIALLLLALVATGTFGVLLSTSRRSTQPDIREEMSLAVERAMNKLQAYVYPADDLANANTQIASFDDDIKGNLEHGLCGYTDETFPMGSDYFTHNIDCMLPPICDKNNSYFTYQIKNNVPSSKLAKQKLQSFDIGSASDLTLTSPYSIEFEIVCNGYKL